MLSERLSRVKGFMGCQQDHVQDASVDCHSRVARWRPLCRVALWLTPILIAIVQSMELCTCTPLSCPCLLSWESPLFLSCLFFAHSDSAI